MKYDLQR